MKALTLTVIGLILILLASYAAISYESNSYKLKTFVIEGNKENIKTNHQNLKTFAIWQKQAGKSMLIHTIKQTESARKRNLKYQQRDEEIEECINKITKNWKRTYYKESYEKIYEDKKAYKKNMPTEEKYWWEEDGSALGYDEDEDFRLRWRLRNKALNEEEIC